MGQRNINRGGVIQRKYIKITDTFVTPVTGTNLQKLDFIKISITPKSKTSKILVRVGLTGALPNNFNNLKFGIYRNNTALGSFNSRYPIFSYPSGQKFASSLYGSGSGDLPDLGGGNIFSIDYEHLDDVIDQQEVTYYAYASNETTYNNTLYINRTTYINAPSGYSYIEVSEIEN